MESHTEFWGLMFDPVTVIAVVAIVALGISLARDRRRLRRRHADPRVITLSGRSQFPRRNERLAGAGKGQADISTR